MTKKKNKYKNQRIIYNYTTILKSQYNMIKVWFVQKSRNLVT